MNSLDARICAPGPALLDTLPSPPDRDGRRWQSRVSRTLADRARARGVPEVVALTEFLIAVGEPPRLVARVEAGLEAPSPAYRARAAAALGVPAAELFAAIDATTQRERA